MAQKTIQIADKPTLDATKGLLENSGYGLKAIKNAITSSSGGSGVRGIQIGKIINECAGGNVSVSTLPYSFYQGSAVVYNNQIHILGGNGSGNYTNHYKYNGSSWTRVSTLPYDFSDGSAVVYNGEIHILGGYRSSGTDHYKYNGSSWVSVSTLPYEFYWGSAVVYNNEIHILGGRDGNTKHYKYDGTLWTSVSTLPYNFTSSSAVVYNNQIHILGSSYSSDYSKYHYKFNGSSWERVSTLPYYFHCGAAVVYNDEIHILGSGYYNSSGSTTDEQYPNSKYHYKFDGSLWKQTYTLPYNFYYGSTVVYNDEIHILGGNYNSNNHYSLNNDYHHITTMLAKGIHILLSNNENIIYTNNATKIASNIAEVTETGTVEIIAEFPDPDNTQPFLTFY